MGFACVLLSGCWCDVRDGSECSKWLTSPAEASCHAAGTLVWLVWLVFFYFGSFYRDQAAESQDPGSETAASKLKVVCPETRINERKSLVSKTLGVITIMVNVRLPHRGVFLSWSYPGARLNQKPGYEVQHQLSKPWTSRVCGAWVLTHTDWVVTPHSHYDNTCTVRLSMIEPCSITCTQPIQDTSRIRQPHPPCTLDLNQHCTVAHPRLTHVRRSTWSSWNLPRGFPSARATQYLTTVTCLRSRSARWN